MNWHEIMTAPLVGRMLAAAEATTEGASSTTTTNGGGVIDWHALMLNHFVWGLALGLLLAIFIWISNFSKTRVLSKEVRRLREHLHTQMDITAKGNSVMQAENTALKQQNENLRVAVREWQTKPGRAELRMLAVYERAIRIMNQNAPGFSPVWERAVKESEDEVVAADTGVSSMLRRAFSPFAALGNGGRTDKPTASAGDTHYDETTNGQRTPPVDS